MSKRKLASNNGEEYKAVRQTSSVKTYSLDSDEEDVGDEDNVLSDDELEGEEEGISRNVGEERFTAFNMREELEEGHFDKDGHFIWKNEKEVRDNWLDNIDWQSIKTDKLKEAAEKGLGEESDDSDEVEPFKEIEVYKKILSFMEPKETISKSLSRLGGKNKLSSIERLRRKKAGLLDTNNEVTELTELTDKVLSKTGNMNIYQETFEMISTKIKNHENKSNSKSIVNDSELDMFADDFGTKEKKDLDEPGSSAEAKSLSSDANTEVMWQFKWKQNDEKLEGPFDTRQMLKWVNEGYFKDGAWVKRQGEPTFYSTKRIDFELYM